MGRVENRPGGSTTSARESDPAPAQRAARPVRVLLSRVPAMDGLQVLAVAGLESQEAEPVAGVLRLDLHVSPGRVLMVANLDPDRWKARTGDHGRHHSKAPAHVSSVCEQSVVVVPPTDAPVERDRNAAITGSQRRAHCSATLDRSTVVTMGRPAPCRPLTSPQTAGPRWHRLAHKRRPAPGGSGAGRPCRAALLTSPAGPGSLHPSAIRRGPPPQTPPMGQGVADPTPRPRLPLGSSTTSGDGHRHVSQARAPAARATALESVPRFPYGSSSRCAQARQRFLARISPPAWLCQEGAVARCLCKRGACSHGDRG